MGAIGQHAKAWTAFWQDQPRSSGCFASSSEILGQIQHHWRYFASSLAAGSRLVDLGCGTCSAGRALVGANPLLSVVGVDFATLPATGDPRIEIFADTRIESLPFAGASLDAAVSQFGFEYASIDDASRELARVLRPGAPFSFLVHHSQSRIATDCVTHRKALEAICGADVGSAFLSGDAAALARRLMKIRNHLPLEQIVNEAAQGLFRHIGLASTQRAQIWQAVKAALAPELVMLADLEASWVSPNQIESWLAPLGKWFDVKPATAQLIAGGRPLCWKIEGVRKTGPTH